MNAITAETTPGVLVRSPGPVHRVALAAVWFTVALSAVVFTEPAPVDALMMGLILALPILGLVRVTPPLIVYLSIWLVAGACALIGTINAVEPTKALVHTAVTFFLTASSFVIAGFVMRRPAWHTQLIMHAYVIAAVVAVLAGLVGYFNLFPGAYDLFTRYGRASGTFKDPNVFGPFLIPPIVYLLHRVLTRSLGRAMLVAAWMILLVFGVLLSFSRGAWINLGVAVMIFGYLTFVTASTNLQRVKILLGAMSAIMLGMIALVVALQVDGVAKQLSDRATLTQSYDEGPEGRFGGQEKARRLILENPFGIGAQQFAPHHHLEEPHNVYLAMFLNAGWVGGMIFTLMVALTCIYGLRHAFRRTRTQGLFIVALACFVAHAFQGFVIDLDHWRHFHLLMAIIWGLMLGDRQIVRKAPLWDPRHIFEQAELIVAKSRPARLLQPLPAAPPKRRTYARRTEPRDDSRPGRAQGRTFARNVPDA